MKRSFPINFLLIMFFTLLGMAVMGYHPSLEDDGIYLTAVKSRLNPALYPHNADFFRLQMQASLFDKCVAGFVHLTAIPLAATELLWQFLSIALILFACWTIARKLFPEARAQWAGVALVTAMFTLPVAGTALYLVDQHLHPRAMATGIILLAVSRIMQNEKWQAAPLLLLALLLHPLMAVMGVSFCVFLSVALLEPVHEWVQVWREAEHGSVAASFVPLGWIFMASTPAWQANLQAHSYMFFDRWEWYECLGAVAPLFLFWLLWWFARKRGENLLARFALAVILYGVFQLAAAMVLLNSPRLIRLVPLQPMRFLHLMYFFLMLVAGCLLGKYLLKKSVWRWAIFLVTINAGMLAAQRMQFTGSEHLELLGRNSANPWLEAFTWIRQNTPTDAYFALDPEYLAVPGEDYHSFRALAERSQLADNIKDAAVVTLVPELGEVWAQQVKAQGCDPVSRRCAGWNRFQLADFEQLKTEFGVDWVLVSYPAPAGLGCPWHNDVLAVCRIP
ncbi:MAG: hypothetical protein ABSF70_02010 [Terracidiphilus sp.]